MITSLQDWSEFLGSSHRAVSLPLILSGLSLMFFGWRMWKLCVVVAFGLLGAGLAVAWIPGADEKWIYPLAVGGALGAASYKPAKYAVGVLGGLMGGGVLAYSLSGLGLQGATLWCVAGAAVIVSTAYAFINRQHVVILVTALLGASLAVSGLAAIVMVSPSLSGSFGAMASYSVIVLPFALLVPTVMSCFYQVAEIRRLQIDL